MLARYQIVRGKRPPGDPLPEGIRQDTRKHTRHCLRPTAKMVAALLAAPTEANFRRFAGQYRELVAGRFAEDRAPFDELAALAGAQDVYLGCSCPTAKNPDVNHCHTVLALKFMRRHYPKLDVQFPRAQPHGG